MASRAQFLKIQINKLLLFHLDLIKTHPKSCFLKLTEKLVLMMGGEQGCITSHHL
jgi:hypothetical protein